MASAASVRAVCNSCCDESQRLGAITCGLRRCRASGRKRFARHIRERSTSTPSCGTTPRRRPLRGCCCAVTRRSRSSGTSAGCGVCWPPFHGWSHACCATWCTTRLRVAACPSSHHRVCCQAQRNGVGFFREALDRACTHTHYDRIAGGMNTHASTSRALFRDVCGTKSSFADAKHRR